MDKMKPKRSAMLLTLLLLQSARLSVSWHLLGNTQYHCWPLSASATKPDTIDCLAQNIKIDAIDKMVTGNFCLWSISSVKVRWVSTPGDTIKTNEGFNMTYELTVDDSFYTWMTLPANNYFSKANIVGLSNATEAKIWCETTVCPAVSSAREDNCCVHHVNVHSCPLAMTEVGLCGPWISPNGKIVTHSQAVVGPITTGNWTSHISGLYTEGVTSLIAHFKIAGVHVALEKRINVESKAVCGDNICDGGEGETCNKCPADCGQCPLKVYELALIGVGAFVFVFLLGGIFGYLQYQKRKLLWDESWIIPPEKIREDSNRRGAFGSMVSTGIGSGMDNSSGRNSLAMSSARKQIFAKTALYDGRTVAVKRIRKKEFTLSKTIRWEVKYVRVLDHVNLCTFVGGCIEVPNVSIVTEYCPKGSLSDVLLNEDVPLNWSFRLSMANDIARGMTYLHSHKIYHGRLKSSNCVVDDRWTVKITDFSLRTYRAHYDASDDDDEQEERYYQEKRAQVYKAPEFLDMVVWDPTPAADVYAYSIILIEIASRNDPYEDEDPIYVPKGWKPPLPDMTPKDPTGKDNCCPCSDEYIELIQDCREENPTKRPSFETVKKTLYKINPNKMSPVDLMMTMMEKYSKHLENIVAERTQDLLIEKQKTDRLLYSMLPKRVADDLRIGKSVSAENFNACTIYFSDIVGFTTISGGSTPMEVVGLLNKLYIAFDEIIDRFQVYKVETIGDAYMVVSGIPEVNPFHAREVANMAIELIKACRTFVIPHRPGELLKIRVGLHSGPACAGVVGLKMPRYCLFGDTVNTASRMESNGEAFKIHISNLTYLELKKIGGYKTELRGTIPVKGKGDMKTWWLIGHDTEHNTELNNDKEKSKEEFIPKKEKIIKNDFLTDNVVDTYKISTDEDEMDRGQEKGLIRAVGNEIAALTCKNENQEEINTELDVNAFEKQNNFLFAPIELPTIGDIVVKQRKISNNSTVGTANDSGYKDKERDDPIPDVNQIIVQSYVDLQDAARSEEDA